MSGKIIELEITDLAFDGKAVGHLDGKVVFVNGGLPGELIEAEIIRSKPRYNQARLLRVTRKSEQRIDPVCIHDDYCGGCTWQDLQYQKQLFYKQKQVVDSIERLGKFENVAVEPIIAAEETFFYRNKMEFSFHTDENSGFTLGLHHRGAFDKVFDLIECHLQSETSNKIVSWLRDYVKKNNLEVYDVRKHTGYMRFCIVREGKNTGQLMVNIVTNYGDFPDADQFCHELTEEIPAVTTILHNQNGQKSNISAGEIEKILFGPGFIEEKLFEMKFRILANSFFQTNSRQTEVLYQTAFDMFAPDKDDCLLDLYCGTGTIGILLAGRVKEVVGVELVADAISVANENAALNGVKNITFHEANVTKYLKEAVKNDLAFDGLIIDPPRAGLHPKALKRIIELKPKRILYISCNPATFARDASLLCESGYDLPTIKPVDMFPHTRHIELVAVLYRQ